MVAWARGRRESSKPKEGRSRGLFRAIWLGNRSLVLKLLNDWESSEKENIFRLRHGCQDKSKILPNVITSVYPRSWWITEIFDAVFQSKAISGLRNCWKRNHLINIFVCSVGRAMSALTENLNRDVINFFYYSWRRQPAATLVQIYDQPTHLMTGKWMGVGLLV